MRIVAIAIACSVTTARADVAIDPCACSPNKPGFHRSSALTGDWNGVRTSWFDHGIKIQGTYAGEVFAAPGLDTDRLAVAGLAALAVDVDLATLADNQQLGAVHVSAFGIHGRGLSEQLKDVYGVSNNVAPEGVRLFEAWFEQPFGPFALRAGLLAADQEYVLAEHSTVLLNSTFGIFAMVSYNIGNPVYPVATPGASARVETDDVTVRAAIYDGDQMNRYGIPSELGEHAFAIGEVELLGMFKLGAWHHTARGDGYYAIVDHQLERYVGAFARLGLARDQPISLYADTGIRIGPGPLRKRDFASVGLAFARTDVGAQTAVEATYQILITGWLTAQPDVQLLLTRAGTAGIFAMRAVVAF